MKTTINIIHKHRVKTLDELKTPSELRFEKVKISFSDGKDFYDGWVQDLNSNSGPTVFFENYINYKLEKEIVSKHSKFDVELPLSDAQVQVAVNANIEDIIDLRFHNYFDGGYHRISAFQSLNQKIDEKNLTWVVEINGLIVAQIYYILQDNGIAYLDDLYVHQNFRNNGFASRLINCSLKKLKENRCRQIKLKIIGDLKHCAMMKNFYERFKFINTECLQTEPGDLYSMNMIRLLD